MSEVRTYWLLPRAITETEIKSLGRWFDADAEQVGELVLTDIRINAEGTETVVPVDGDVPTWLSDEAEELEA